MGKPKVVEKAKQAANPLFKHPSAPQKMSSIALPEALRPAVVGHALRRRANMFLQRAEELGCAPGRLWWTDLKAKAELERPKTKNSQYVDFDPKYAAKNFVYPLLGVIRPGKKTFAFGALTKEERTFEQAVVEVHEAFSDENPPDVDVSRKDVAMCAVPCRGVVD